MNLSDFDYLLPPDRIAQHPPAERGTSRMLLLERGQRRWEDRLFVDLPDLLRGDELLVVNNTSVLPARLFGVRRGIHAEPVGQRSRRKQEHLQTTIEVLLTRRLKPDLWEALVRPGRKMRVGERVVFGDGKLEAEVVARGEYGLRRLQFFADDVDAAIDRMGHVPLPPYIDRPDEREDRERYQTVFARHRGAVAAPTAGLHFTAKVLDQLRGRGVELCEITLHVGLGTFQPIHTERVEDHHMHREAYEISERAAAQIQTARRDQRPVVAVGTTVVRALEDAACKMSAGATERSGHGWAEAEIFIYPGHAFRVVNQMVTNFHLPKSSLLMMVSAFADRDLILQAYDHAIRNGYRFYSYGDCMLIR